MAEDFDDKDNTEETEDNAANIPVEAGLEVDSNGELYKVAQLSGMYQDWFLDYASYVILERAVPHIADGLKPVQRRILHSMRRLEDGRYNKVANIIGHTMQFHPHGDASIGDALVQLGQKELLIDCQGNWGNILTGDSSAAPRYIEARLSKFALDVIFNPKTTQWKPSYDGRNQEPVTLPVKFPLLLTQGVEGIAVGLASKILPHNFNEVINASIAYLKGESFELFPDFPTGGLCDVSRYNEGIRGGLVRVRAKIQKLDKKALVITEIPFGKTTSTLIESILKANEKGKIKIRKVDDNTAQNVEVIVHLAPGISPDKTIDALYAFTDCEVPISPNNCVIEEDKPRFLGVSEMLKVSTNRTVKLLTSELEIRLHELEEAWHMSSLEKIFIENRIYLAIENCDTWEDVIITIDKELNPFKNLLKREITTEDITKLTEIKIKRISRFDAKKADELIKSIEKEREDVLYNLQHIIPFSIKYFQEIKKKYGKGKERKTELRNFEAIVATQVVVANEKLYIDRENGFAGTGLKKDEYVCDCSDIDEIIVFRADGTYFITKVAEKIFLGKNAIHVAVYNRNDNRTVYNLVYRDGKNGNIMVKRSGAKGLTRDKEYNITKGTPDSAILYFTANPNGEAETIKITLKPRPRLKSLTLEFNFGSMAIKGRDSIGNILTRFAIHKITLLEKGTSTLGGQQIWIDQDVNRLNTDGRGLLLGEFQANDKLVVMTQSGTFRLSTYDLENHFEEDMILIEKHQVSNVYTAVYWDATQQFYYLKRFNVEPTDNTVNFIDEENANSKLICFSAEKYPRFKITFGGKHAKREPEIVSAEEFIAVKGFKARGKRLTTFEVSKVEEIEPLIKEEPEPEPEPETTDNLLDLNLETGFNSEDDKNAEQMTLGF
jgi:topoisomerase IV subunit A